MKSYKLEGSSAFQPKHGSPKKPSHRKKPNNKKTPAKATPGNKKDPAKVTIEKEKTSHWKKLIIYSGTWKILSPVQSRMRKKRLWFMKKPLCRCSILSLHSPLWLVQTINDRCRRLTIENLLSTMLIVILLQGTKFNHI